MKRARLLAAFAFACASPGMPPGGPPDAEIPEIVRITPDTNAVNVTAKAVLIHFNEVISERPAAAGAGGGAGLPGLGQLVQISPTDGRDVVNWRRTAIEIKPRRGFRPNTAYRITLLPGVADLRGNVMAERTDLVFSTGSEIPDGEIRGAFFDWAAASPGINARIEVSRPADSTFYWVARADSSGRFSVRELSAGTYRVRAWLDANSDRFLGPDEASDTATVTVADSVRIELYGFARDTLAPVLQMVEVRDSTVLRLRFNRAVAGDWDGTGAITIIAEDSSETSLAGNAVPAAVFDSLAAVERAARDSAAALEAQAADSAAAPVADSAAVPEPAAPAVPATPTPAPAAARDSVGEPAAAELADSLAAEADTIRVREPPPPFNRIRPYEQWVIRLDAPLAPGSYRVRVTNARGLNGLFAETERELRVAEPPPPPEPEPDSTVVVPPDSTMTLPPVSRPRR